MYFYFGKEEYTAAPRIRTPVTAVFSCVRMKSAERIKSLYGHDTMATSPVCRDEAGRGRHGIQTWRQ
jgi:hypothetical protein